MNVSDVEKEILKSFQFKIILPNSILTNISYTTILYSSVINKWW